MELAEFQDALRQHEARVGRALERALGGTEGVGAGAGRPPDSWREELQGIRSELGELRGSLEQLRARPSVVLEHGLLEGLRKALGDEGLQRQLADALAIRRHGEAGAVAAGQDDDCLHGQWVKSARGSWRNDGGTRPLQEPRERAAPDSHPEQTKKVPAPGARPGGAGDPARDADPVRATGAREPSPHPQGRAEPPLEERGAPGTRRPGRWGRSIQPIEPLEPLEPLGAAPGPPGQPLEPTKVPASCARPGGAGDLARDVDSARATDTNMLSSRLQGRIEPHWGMSVASTGSCLDTPGAAKSVPPVLKPCLAFFDKLGTSEAPQRSDPLSKFVDSPLFSALVYTAIILNCVLMVVSADQEMHFAINEGTGEPSDWIDYGALAFLCVYSIELVLKLWRYHWHFFYDPNWKYNLFDVAIVLTGIYSEAFHDVLPNSSWMRLLRMIRLVRALRVFRLIAVVEPLRAILHSLVHTFDVLFWSILMLAMIKFIFALILVFRVAEYIGDESHSITPRHRRSLGDAYSSVGQTMLHLFMCSTGGESWTYYYEPLIPTGWENCVLFLIFVAVTQIALMNIILGVFVDSAMQNLNDAKEQTAEDHALKQKEVANELRDLCYRLGADADGMLSQEEWRHAIRKPTVRNQLEMMNFRVSEVREFLDHMCVGADDKAIHVETFVSAVMRFRGSASCFDMQMLLHAVDDIKALLQHAQKVQ